MNGHLFRRAVAIFGLYLVVLLVLVVVQFSRHTGFTLTVGSIAVSGKYADREEVGGAGEDKTLSGPLGLFFGGMEFQLSEDDGFVSVGSKGNIKTASAIGMVVSDNHISIRVSDGSVLLFQTAFSDGAETLRVSATLAPTVSELRLPYRPLRSSRVAELSDGRSAVISGGDSYAFIQSTLDSAHRLVVLKKSSPSLAYGKIMPQKKSSPEDFVLPQAADKQLYERALLRWRDQAYIAWERIMADQPNEETVVAYVTESAHRGAYRTAVATTPKAFAEGQGRSYRSAVYFGRLDEALRTLSASERETLGRLSRFANERDLALFMEPNLIAYLSIRGSRALSSDVASFARTIDPASITPALSMGVLECWADWKQYQKGEDNPFDRLVDQARFVLTGLLKRMGDGSVFPVISDKVDVAFALRAGQALIRSSEISGNKTLANLGRTLVFSVIDLADQSGSVPSSLMVTKDFSSASPDGQARLSAATLYRTLVQDGIAPRALPLLTDSSSSLWTWFGAYSATASVENSIMDISVNFIAGETHYMLIRGVKPFTKIQLYGIDFRTDPRFERYDSSGWAYSASEQTLLVKMKHKSATEHIRIFF